MTAPRITAALTSADPERRDAGQYALDSGDMSDLDWLDAREAADAEYADWAYSYEVRTGRTAPDMEFTRWAV